VQQKQGSRLLIKAYGRITTIANSNFCFMKLIQEKITYGRAKTVVLLVIVLLILSVVTTLAMIYLADFFTN
jgi:hypothetical protein